MAAVGSVRMSSKTPTVLQDAIIPKRNPITMPDPTPYGIFAQALAQVLAQPQKGETANWSNRMQLKSNARSEQERYSQDLADANAAAMEQARRDAYYGIQEKSGGILTR